MKSATPHVPTQPNEIIESAVACYNEGAAICHIHARDENDVNSADLGIFDTIHKGIREKCNVIIQDSTGGGPNLTQEERLNCLDAKPEMASLNMGSLMRIAGQYKGVAWSNMPDEIEWYVNTMREKNVKPEMEIYNLAMLRDVNAVIKKGLVDNPYYINIVLGMTYQGACNADIDTLKVIVDRLPEDAYFNVTAVGAGQLPLTTMGMLMGGCVRVGLEDNIYYKKGELATNQQLVARAARIARELGKEPCTPDEAREILGLK